MGLQAGKKRQHSQAVHVASTSMRNGNKIAGLSHTSGWQEVHTVAVLLCHGGVTHTTAVVQHQQPATMLNCVFCWCLLIPEVHYTNGFLQMKLLSFREVQNQCSLLTQQVPGFVLLWNFCPLDQANTICSFSVHEPYFLSLSALLFGL